MARILFFEDLVVDCEIWAKYMRHDDENIVIDVLDSTAAIDLIKSENEHFDLAIFDVFEGPDDKKVGLDLAKIWEKNREEPFMFLTNVRQKRSDLDEVKNSSQFKGYMIKSQTTRGMLLEKIREVLA